MGAAASLGRSVFGRGLNEAVTGGAQANAALLSADSRLPDGTAFAAGNSRSTFSKTYYVDNGDAKADDNGPGTKARPFRTINKAAQVLQPGERVVIASGTYRECVRPARGGTSPTQMISYEAAPGAKVFIKGSEVLKDGWVEQPIPAGVRACRPGRAGAAGHRMAPRIHRRDVPRCLQSLCPAQHHGQLGMARSTRRSTWARICAGADWCSSTASRWSRWSSIASWPRRSCSPSPDFTVPAQPQNGLPPRRRGGPIMQEIGGSPDARFWVDPSGRPFMSVWLRERPPIT